jgi:hypothetical protein
MDSVNYLPLVLKAFIRESEEKRQGKERSSSDGVRTTITAAHGMRAIEFNHHFVGHSKA